VKYAVEMGSGVMIPCFIKTVPGIQELIGNTQTTWRSHKPTYIVSK
jgi:hypothetical protein